MFFFSKKKTASKITRWLESRGVLSRSLPANEEGVDPGLVREPYQLPQLGGAEGPRVDVQRLDRGRHGTENGLRLRVAEIQRTQRHLELIGGRDCVAGRQDALRKKAATREERGPEQEGACLPPDQSHKGPTR